MTPRKSNSFEKALADAEKRLAKALNERQMAQEVLNDLALEIPSLQQTISALQRQLNPKVVSLTEVSHMTNAQIDEALAKVAADVPSLLSEDDLLPEPEGTPLLPED